MTAAGRRGMVCDMGTKGLKRALAAASIMALILAACGDDDEAADDAPTETTVSSEAVDDDGTDAGATDTTAAAGRGDVDAYCEAVLEVETVPFPDIDFESASPEEIGAGLAGYVEVLRPLVDDLVEAAPDEIAVDVDVLSAAVDEIGTSEEDPFEEPAVAASEGRVHAFDLDNCGWNVESVTATEYAFDGLSDDLASGPTSFELANRGEELHELVLARINDGVTQSAEEILALPEEEAFALVTPLPGEASAAQGETDYLVADLEPGRYLAACFIPVGATGQGPPPPDSPPHALEGMFAQFTVG